VPTKPFLEAKHLGMMTVRGNFPELTATGYIDPDHPEASAAEVTIQTASLRTHNPQRDNDLRSSNFLEVDKHPTITFNMMIDGRWVVSNEVDIFIEGEFVEQKQEQTA
jgi:polyisoprenoid-binding protein YceI